MLGRVPAFFQLNQAIYWVALATWFGSSMFIAIAAPIIFRVVREHDPTLPGVLSVNLDAQHATLLAGTIVSRLMRVITRIGIACALMVTLGLIGQAVITQPIGQQRLQLLLRAAVAALAGGALVYDWRSVAPRLFAARQQYIDEADNPDVANAARERFDRLSHESVNVLFVQTLLLCGLIFFSANISSLSPYSG